MTDGPGQEVTTTEAAPPPATTDADAAALLPTLGASPGPVLASDSLAAAGRKVMWVQLERLLMRQPRLADPEQPDELRRYRVAIRRLRAGARLFGDAYPRGEIRPLRRGLSELADVVGSVRDLDLRIADLNRWALERGTQSHAAVGPMRLAWADDRARAAMALLARIQSRRHGRFLARLATFVEAPPPTERRAPAGPSTIADRVASMTWSGYEAIRAFAPVVRWANVETLHDLRIATKRVRDGLDLLRDVVGPSRAWLNDRLVGLQDHLGRLNDAAVTAAAVRAFLEARHHTLRADEQAEIAAYLADREREVTRLRRSVVRPWRTVTGITFARRLGRLVVLPAATPPPRARS